MDPKIISIIVISIIFVIMILISCVYLIFQEPPTAVEPPKVFFRTIVIKVPEKKIKSVKKDIADAEECKCKKCKCE